MSILESLTLGALLVGLIGIVGSARILGPHMPELSRRYGKGAVFGVCLVCVLAWPLVLAMALVNVMEGGRTNGGMSHSKDDERDDIAPTAAAARDLLGN